MIYKKWMKKSKRCKAEKDTFLIAQMKSLFSLSVSHVIFFLEFQVLNKMQSVQYFSLNLNKTFLNNSKMRSCSKFSY